MEYGRCNQIRTGKHLEIDHPPAGERREKAGIMKTEKYYLLLKTHYGEDLYPSNDVMCSTLFFDEERRKMELQIEKEVGEPFYRTHYWWMEIYVPIK